MIIGYWKTILIGVTNKGTTITTTPAWWTITFYLRNDICYTYSGTYNFIQTNKWVNNNDNS